MTSSNTPHCSFCESKPADGESKKYCAECEALMDKALDEVCGGPGEFENMLSRHFAKGTRQ